jgi:D-glycero-D-manno-heptose 1,7-bisphosphate phosphatase
MTVRRPAVFLDRDGVVTDPVLVGGRERPAWSLAELVVTTGAADAVRALREAGFALVVVTNQPDIARGGLTPEVLAGIHEHLGSRLVLDAVYVCPHDGAEGCDCRKPSPGMLLRAAADLDLDLARSWLVGDRWVDIAAGRAAGVRTVLVERPGSFAPTSAGAPPHNLAPDFVVAGVVDAAGAIIQATRSAVRRPPVARPPAAC